MVVKIRSFDFRFFHHFLIPISLSVFRALGDLGESFRTGFH
jgi:hypothetical protein